jgi:hypothetical protein
LKGESLTFTTWTSLRIEAFWVPFVTYPTIQVVCPNSPNEALMNSLA